MKLPKREAAEAVVPKDLFWRRETKTEPISTRIRQPVAKFEPTPTQPRPPVVSTRYSSFVKNAEIRPFGRKLVQLPTPRRSFNDDVHVEAYAPAALTYAGKQRKGIHENFESCTSMEDHVHRALGEQFPLSVDTPLPQDTRAAALFSRDSTPEQLRSFWESQLLKLEKLVQDSELAQEKWGGDIPDGIKPAAGKLKTVAISQLMDQCGLQGKRWVRQFALGPPVTGELPQRSLTSVTGSAQTCYPGRPSLNLHLLVSKKGHLSVGRLMPRSCGLKLPIR